MKRHARLPIALAVVGVFLGRGAQADTILEFDNQPTNQGVPQSFGDNAAVSSEGVSVVGFGTPNLGLSWQAAGAGDSEWQFYNDSVWAAVQLNASVVGSTYDLRFTPNSSSARVIVDSFNFHPYYNSTERFTFTASVLAGATVVSGPTNLSFLSDGTKNHAVSLTCTGAPGQTLKLRIERLASTLGAGEVEGDPYDIAVDDIRFAQLPETVLPAGPQVVSTTPADGQTGVAAVYYPYLAGITNGDTTLAAGSIQLRFDGGLVPPLISSAEGLTNVSYTGTSLLPSGSSHTYTLSYNDNLGATYTHEVGFTVAAYPTLPSAYALPLNAGVTTGFTYRTVAADVGTNTLASTLARAEAQLDGTLINPETSQPYTNTATPGPNPDGSYDIDTVLNFDNEGNPATGNFPANWLFPGLDFYPNDWFSTEALLHLELPAGYYRFGVNSDDGFRVTAVAPPGVPGAPVVLGFFDDGRAAADTLFDFLVPVGGIYPFRLVYFESTGSGSCEFFSQTLSTGQLLLINDPAEPNAIKSYRVLKPFLTQIARDGQNVVLQWAYGNPPFQVQFKSDLSNPNWTDSGSPTTARTATVPVQAGAGFFRIAGQP